MSHIIELELKFNKKLHPSFWVRLFSYKYAKIKIGFIFNYRAFLNAYGSFDMSLDDMNDLSLDKRNSLIIYGAALEYCRTNKLRVFFDEKDISESLQRVSVDFYKKILEAMSYARMPDWLQEVMDNLPKEKDQGIKKK